MNKIKNLFIALFAFISLISLASCSDTSGVEGELTKSKVTNDSITLAVSFKANENIRNELAKPFVKMVKADDESADATNKDVEFKNDVYTDSTVEFTKLTKDTEYLFTLCVTYNSVAEEIYSLKVTTSNAGDEENPLEIASVEDFLRINENDKGHYKLVADIDFTDYEDEILQFNTGSSTSEKPFKGELDGQGHTIKGVKLTTDSYSALFGSSDGATFKNIKIDGVTYGSNSTRSTTSIATLVGKAKNTTFEDITITNLDMKIETYSSTTGNIGGLVGYAIDSTIKNCSVSGALNISKSRLKLNVGMLCGLFESANKTSIENCSVSGTLSSSITVQSTGTGFVNLGGLVAKVNASSDIKNNTVDLAITATRENSVAKSNIDYKIGGLFAEILAGQGEITGNTVSVSIKAASKAEVTEDELAKVEAPVKPEDDATEEAKKQYEEDLKAFSATAWGFALSNKLYVGGLVGYVSTMAPKLTGNTLTIKEEGINIITLANPEEAYVFYGVEAGQCSNSSKLDNTVSGKLTFGLIVEEK